MKVNLYITEEVSDAQRVKIAALIDGAGAKKRIATRDEIKDFLWTQGKDWSIDLDDADAETVDDPSDDDLI